MMVLLLVLSCCRGSADIQLLTVLLTVLLLLLSCLLQPLKMSF
jgi:hypothetical protein